MKFDLKKVIETNYNLNINLIDDAPRQFVAQTFIVRTERKTFFCKVVDKKSFIPGLIASLPALYNIHQLGFKKINYPILTNSQKLYVMHGDTLVVLFNYIDAIQNYTYDNFTFGVTLAKIHNLSSRLTAYPPKESFEFKHKKTFENETMDIINSNDKSEVATNLRNLLKERKKEIFQIFDNFLEVSKKCKKQKWHVVITHGDAPGNILVKSPKNFYIIDWDDILLAPAERDLWFFEEKEEFINGYKSVFPDFSLNQDAVSYYTYSRYLNDLVDYWREIVGENSLSHKRKNFQQMRKELFEKSGWLYPVLKSV